MKFQPRRCIGLALASLSSGTANAAPATPLFAMVKHIDCGPFTVDTKIEMTHAGGTYADVKAESIALHNNHDGFSGQVNLAQHKSHSYHGRSGHWLDAIASDATYIRSRAGESYLLIGFTCWNPAATTCRTAMDQAGSEWDQIYDAHARPLTAGQFETGEDEKQLDAMGLGSRQPHASSRTVALWR